MASSVWCIDFLHFQTKMSKFLNTNSIDFHLQWRVWFRVSKSVIEGPGLETIIKISCTTFSFWKFRNVLPRTIITLERPNLKFLIYILLNGVLRLDLSMEMADWPWSLPNLVIGNNWKPIFGFQIGWLNNVDEELKTNIPDP